MYGSTMALSHILLTGTRREIGLTQGRRIRALRLPPLSAGDRAFGQECRSLASRWHVAMCEEFDGMLEASGLPADRFTSYYFGRTAPFAGGCTNIAVVADGAEECATLVGRNYDWAYADRRWCEARLIAPKGEVRRIGYTHHWGGLCDVMNEHGLTLCIASLPITATVRPGLQWHIVADLIAATCRTALEAADLLRRIPHLRSLGYLVADGRTARLVEASAEGVVVHEPEDGILVGTNHRLGSHPAPGEHGHASAVRRARALELLQPRAGHLTLHDIRRALSDHEGGICAGAHGSVSGLSASGTIWSLLAEPAKKLMRVAPGHPCETPFETIPWPQENAPATG